MATPALRIGCPLQAPLFDVDEARSTGRAGRQRDGHSSGLPSGGDDENAPSPFDQGKNEHCKGCRQKRWQQPNDPAPEQSANLPQQSTQRHGQEGNNIARHVTLHAGPLHYWYYQPVEQPWCGPAGPPTPVLPWKWRGGPGTRPKRPPAPQQTVEQTNVKWETMFERLKTYKNDYGGKKKPLRVCCFVSHRAPSHSPSLIFFCNAALPCSTHLHSRSRIGSMGSGPSPTRQSVQLQFANKSMTFEIAARRNG